MSRLRFNSPRLLLLLLLSPLMLCLAAGSAGAQEDLIWPVESDLLQHDANISDLWHDVGDVAVWNTKDDLKIAINPAASRISEVSIHIVQDPADFAAVLDSKGKPSANLFDYKTSYLNSPADHHLQVIPLQSFEICWGVDPVKCPPDLYAIVLVELEGASEATFAKAENSGAFVRTNREEFLWGWYLVYPLAKVDPGHFVDANVNGLTYQTPTQFGTTGDGGQFWYIEGERVALSVGSLPLGDVLGDRRTSPVSLFEGSDLDDDRVLNVARLLQSLDGDGNPAQGAINITAAVIGCLESALAGLPPVGTPEVFFSNDAAVSAVIDATVTACAGQVPLTVVSKEEARENLNSGMQAGNLMNRNVSKAPELKSDMAKLEILPFYVPAQRPDGSRTDVVYHDADGLVIETRSVAKPIVVSYLEEVEGTGTMDVYVAISMDDGDSWKRKNVSRTADKSSMAGNHGVSEKPMLKVKDNMIFVAWTDKYCRGGRPGYAITVCPDTDGNGLPDPCEVCRETSDGTVCNVDYPGDDAYFQDDLYGVGGPQRSVFYTEYPQLGEVAYSCVWTARAVVEPDGNVQWFKPERLTSGRRDAYQLFAGAGDDVAFGIVWQEDPKGLMPGEAEGPGDGWSGSNTHSKTDIWYSYIKLDDFALIDYGYPVGGHGDNDDLVDLDPELAGRVKALVPMSLPVKVSDNDVCSLENMLAEGGGEHDHDGEGEGTHRYCGTVEGIGTAEAPGTNPLCAYTVEKANPNGDLHHVCVTADGRLLDGNTGASRPNLFLQPYKRPDGTKSAWAIIAYEESKGVGSPPEHEEGDDCGDDTGDDPGDDRYRPDMGKNVIYHSFDFALPEVAGGGGIVNLPETDAAGNPVYLVDELGAPLLDWKGDPQLAYENARRVRLLAQPKSKAGASQTVVVVLYRQGEEGHGKPADIFLRRGVASPTGNPYAFTNFVPGAQNLSSVEPTLLWQDPYDATKPVKMLRWGWSPANLADASGKNPHDDSIAHRGALSGDEIIIGYSWTPNWGRAANDKYDFYVRRSFNGGGSWTTDPADPVPIEHNVVFKVPVLDEVSQTVLWDEEVVVTQYQPGNLEPPRNVSNLRNNRMSVLEPRVVKAPGTITDLFGNPTGYPEDIQDTSVYQLAYGLEINQTELPDGTPQMPLDIYYSRTRDKGQRFESVIVTPQGGTGRPQEGWNPLAKDKPEQGAVQIRQTPDGSRMYAIWLEEGEGGSDIMFRRVDYRQAV